ncbi:hypothetical protein DIS24_g830 [Lasiodiplodia hormozganensis]|uniref:Uncharacterized protein n=1 Tax=Lasiodiplodia hormozganensis TaxID=869390 RepID=A0AA40D7C9_9PEZI|nr:hypothetical protein DIS24_g830 [Lasiodiplodia hormozganensis]
MPAPPPPNNKPTTTLYRSTQPAIHRLSLIRLLSTIPTILTLIFLASLRHRLRQSLLCTSIWYTHSYLPSFLLDIFIWAPLFYVVAILQLSVFFLISATWRSPEEERWFQLLRAERRRRDEDERARRGQEERRQALLAGGGGGWGARAEMQPLRVRWGKDVKEETKVAWWEQNVIAPRKEVEEGIRLERTGLGEAVRCFT